MSDIDYRISNGVINKLDILQLYLRNKSIRFNNGNVVINLPHINLSLIKITRYNSLVYFVSSNIYLTRPNGTIYKYEFLL